jgi:hypothetical protein
MKNTLSMAGLVPRMATENSKICMFCNEMPSLYTGLGIKQLE